MTSQEQAERIWIEFTENVFQFSRMSIAVGDSTFERIVAYRARYMIVLQATQATRSVSINRRQRRNQKSVTIIVQRLIGQQINFREKWYLTMGPDGEIRRGKRVTKISLLVKELVLLLCEANRSENLDKLLDQYERSVVSG
jgi:nicotinic acid mononucleotide adenylyltransferase